MNNYLGIFIWVEMSALTLRFIQTRDPDIIAFMIWMLVNIRLGSDILAACWARVGWVCIFCGKPFHGTLWNMLTCRCNHEQGL